jgi:hypothetical protein
MSSLGVQPSNGRLTKSRRATCYNSRSSFDLHESPRAGVLAQRRNANSGCSGEHFPCVRTIVLSARPRPHEHNNSQRSVAFQDGRGMERAIVHE